MYGALHRLIKRLMRVTVPLCLAFCLLLTACSGSAQAGLSGNYVDDTVALARSLQETIAMPQDAEGHAEAESEARAIINAYTARYRPRDSVNNLSSFTTMQTAVNSLVGHYNNYANRPLPEALQERLNKELTKAERSALRGS
ncbi:MAG: photosystem II protein Psb27 [Prochlorococcus sp.]|nr:photosystem II protein Psb27 [Prochlorococcaceae cyanobacterium Fu_MAG_50]